MQWIQVCHSSTLGTHHNGLHAYVLSSPDACLPEMLEVAKAMLSVSGACAVLGAMCNRNIEPFGSLLRLLLRPACQQWNAFDPIAIENVRSFECPNKRRAFTESVLDTLMSFRLPHFKPFLEQDLCEARNTRRGPLWRVLQRRARNRWSTVLAACVAVGLWRRWQAHMCEPGSGYIRRVVAPRWHNACQQLAH